MLNQLYENLATISFIVAGIILLMPFLLKKKFGKTHVASLSITIGILGTFAGVFIGLLNFDTQEITESIPKLITGLKTAFVTSIAGLIANIVLRTFPQLYGYQEEKTGKKSDDVGEQIVASLNKVAQSISGDGESTMVTQLQKIRTTNSDGFDKMNKSFNEFADKMVADNTQSLIDALTQVMQDFNTKINEQFGENFKKLNEAVGAMLEWQKEYKEHVENLTERFNKISENITGIDESLSNTAKSHESIYETNDLLKDLINDFSKEVDSFAELGSKAKEAFPIIETNLNSLTDSTNNFVKENIERLNNQYDSFTSAQNDMMRSYKENFDQITAQNVENYTNFSSTQSELLESYKVNVEKMITDNADRIQKLDAELGQELNKALESLGSQLTSLSQHFVNDYRPLTESLRKVVEISKNI